ncbi:hypothetical protein [Streptomyces anulatus]
MPHLDRAHDHRDSLLTPQDLAALTAELVKHQVTIMPDRNP